MRLRFQRFQSIEDAELEIEGLTAIVGPSNIGKSALWRGLFYSLHAKTGNDFVSYGSDFTRVEMQDEDFKMAWEKGEGVNRYFFQDDPVSYPKIKKGEIPKPILDAGFSDILLNGPDGKVKDRISAQFAPQVDGNVFLINSSPGTVSEVLSQLSRLDVLIRASRATDLDARRVSGRIRIRREDEERLRGKRESFSSLPLVSSAISELGVRAKLIQEARNRASLVRGILDKIRVAQGVFDSLSSLSSVRVPPKPPEAAILNFGRVKSCALKCQRARVVASGLQGVSAVRVPAIPTPEVWCKVVNMANSLAPLRELVGRSLPVLSLAPDAEKVKAVGKVWESISLERGKLLEVGRQGEEVSEGLRKVDQDIFDLREHLCSEVSECPLCGRSFP